MLHLQKDDPAVAALVEKEQVRIEDTLDLIAAENHAPASIMEALGSVFNTPVPSVKNGEARHSGKNV